ncbi:type IV conjugative transfer system coupling protein TraD [Hydrogenophaga sp. NFH-34]|uniref:type IV conjugative transfer system coupling protein TraD n=1 Tax=Hydrogenophaga sp. NFH-34 TaxID=2744446 RepID=UPI002DD448D3|nr:type IV conjugative transfer system coupling protein TraD [Hydrogenophaga sp. NFH-34]
MKPDDALEALLRPPVELWSTMTVWGVALVAIVAPWALMMPPWMGWVLAAIAGYFGWVRCKQALHILKYQHGMKYYPVTRMAPHEIPVEPGQLYLGHGFEWSQQHTQRKHEASRPDAERFVKPQARENAMRGLGVQLAAWSKTVPDVSAESVPAAKFEGLRAAVASLTTKAVEWDHWLNPLKAYDDLGGSPVLHGVGALEERPITMRQASRTGHMIVLGTTRVGKSRLLEVLATQDIHAGHVVIVIDPKGDADLMMRLYAEAHRAGRGNQFYLFHLGYPDISARYNGIGNFSRITEVAARATNALPSSGNSAAFKEFSWRFTNLVAQAQVALGRVPTYESLLADVTGIDPLFMDYAHMVFRQKAAEGQYTDYQDRLGHLEGLIEKKKYPVSRALSDRDPPLVAMISLIKELRVPDKVLTGLAAAVSYERSFYEKIIASLGPFLEKLTSGAVGKLISPDYFDPHDKRPIFDWMSVIRQGGIVYCGLDALTDSVVSSAVGNSMLADLVSVGGKLYKTGLDPHHPTGKIVLPTICCHFDEVNEIAGPEFVPMVNKLGGSGFRITAYTQSMFDIEAKVGDKAKAGQILDNFNHLVMLRVRSVNTANLLAEQVPQVDVVHITPSTGVSDSAADGSGVDFTSRNVDIVTSTKVPMIQPADILSLPQGQAFALLEGNRRFKLRIPLPRKDADPFVPESIRQVALDMKARYRTSEQWARETDWLGNQPIGMAGAGVIDTALALRDQVQDEQEDSDGDDSLATRTEPREMDFNSSANATGVLE